VLAVAERLKLGSELQRRRLAFYFAEIELPCVSQSWGVGFRKDGMMEESRVGNGWAE
jgi:hypothetical protein